jgi:adenylate cyclase
MIDGSPIDFAAEGLLDGCEGDAREARIALLEQLFADGASLDEVRRAIAEDRLVTLRVERVLAGEGRYTQRELAELSKVPLDVLLDFRHALGLARPDPDDPAFTDHDLDAARLLGQLLGAGLPSDELLDASRVLGRGLSRGADAIRALLGRRFLATAADEWELALLNAQAADQLLPLTGPMLQYILRLHLIDHVRSDIVGISAQLAAGRMRGSRHVAVCFADLVGFTELGQRVDVEDVGDLATRLEEITSAVVEPPVRLIKTIGDAVMLVSNEIEPIVDTALRLVASARNAHDNFPSLRAGIASGLAVNRAGDWYGPPVNLASRITAVATADSVVATAEVRDAAASGRRWRPTGNVRLKGISEEVALFQAS